MNKKKLFSILTLLTICLSFFVMPVYASVVETSEPISAALTNEAEIVILGSVIRSECIYQDGVIVTRNSVEVQKVFSGEVDVGSTLIVQQLGGTIGDESMPHLTGITVLETDTTYVMFLYSKQTPDDFTYYQSVGNYNVAFEELCLSNNAGLREIEYAIDNRIAQQPMTLDTGGVYTGGWNVSEVDVYVASNSTVSYGGTLHTYLKNGVTSWDGCSSLTVATKNAGSACEVFVYMGDYDLSDYSSSGLSEDVAGATVYSTYGSNGDDPNEYPYKKVYIYLDKNQYSTTSYNSWKAIVCHEMGHALGLSHSDANGYLSIMKSATSDYFSGLITAAPTTGDKNLLAAKYA